LALVSRDGAPGRGGDRAAPNLGRPGRGRVPPGGDRHAGPGRAWLSPAPERRQRPNTCGSVRTFSAYGFSPRRAPDARPARGRVAP